jgi:hypothetical protein
MEYRSRIDGSLTERFLMSLDKDLHDRFKAESNRRGIKRNGLIAIVLKEKVEEWDQDKSGEEVSN